MRRWIIAAAASLTVAVPAAAQDRVDPMAATVAQWFSMVERQFVSLADAMPADRYGFAPSQGEFKGVRTFGEQVKHVACANFGFAAELEGQKPPDACHKGGPSPAKTKKELLIYLRDSFAAVRKSLGAIDAKNMFDPIEGPYAGPNTRLGIATVIVWHNADHYGQMVLYMRENGIVPPASRPNPPKLQESY